MSSTSAMVLNGVLRRGDALNSQGVLLYQSLAAAGRLAILCGEDRDHAEWFLKTNGLNKHTHLVAEDPASSPTMTGRRLAQISWLRGQQAHVEFVIEPDPEMATELFANGIPVLLYLHPQYTRPSFRPDYKNEAIPWEALIHEIDHQERMRAESVIPELD